MIRKTRWRVNTDDIKSAAFIIQILGHGATATGASLLNLYFFAAGLVDWSIVGLRWNDRAMTLIHQVAAGTMLVGLLLH